MYLFFDGVSSKGYIGLFDLDKNLVASENFYIQGNESTKTISIIHEFLEKHTTHYQDIKNILVVAGPGSFTGVRTISLVINTLAYSYKNIFLTPISFFDLYQNYPIVKTSSKRDLFVKYSNSASIEIVQNENLKLSDKNNILYGDIDVEKFSENIKLESTPDYENIFKNIKLENNKNVAPQYIKKPNIS